MQDGTLWYQIPFLVFLILLNAFFSASEVALISLKQTALRRLGKCGRRGHCLKELLADSGKFLATVQIGVTLAGFLASAFAADSFSDPLTDYLEGLGFHFLSHTALDMAVVLFITLILSYLSIVFGELIPKQIALRYSEGIALNIAIPLTFLLKLSTPFVWLLNQSVRIVMKLIGSDNGDKEEISEEEIRTMVDIGEEKGVIDSEEKRMIENVFELNDKQAGELMTHRKEIHAVEINTPPEELEKTVLETFHSRIPVYHKNIDQIVGVLNVRDYLIARLTGNVPNLKTLIRNAYLAPESVKASILLQDMRKQKIHLAVLLDEFGGTAGLVTISDLLEEIVGDFTLDEKNDPSEQEIEVLDERTWRIDGRMQVKEAFQMLGIPLNLIHHRYHNMSKMLLKRLNRIPKKGDRYCFENAGFEFIVDCIDDKRISKMIVHKR